MQTRPAPATLRTFARRVACVALFTSAGAPALVAQPTPDTVDTWIQNVRIVDPSTGRVSGPRHVGIAHGTIIAIRAGGRPPRTGSWRVIDGAGAFAIPGLWDVHTHILQGDSAQAAQQAARLLGYGITHTRDMGSSLAARQAYLRARAIDSAPAPTMIGAGPTFWGYASPYGDSTQRVLITDAAEAARVVAKAKESGVDFIKVYAGIDSVKLAALIRAGPQHRLPVVGHSQPRLPLATHAAMGMRTIEHLDFGTLAECTSNANRYFERVIAARFRNSGESIPAITAAFAAAVDTPACRARLRRAARAGLVLTPTLVVSFLGAADATRLLPSLPPAQQEDCRMYLRQFTASRPEDATRLAQAGRRLMRLVVDAGVPVLAGTDAPTFCAGVGASLPLELALMADGGLSPLEVLRSATTRPAQTLGTQGFGVIRVGAPADLVLLRANPLRSSDAYTGTLGVYTQRRWHDGAALERMRAPR